MRGRENGCISDTCPIPETWRTPRKSFNRNITKKQSHRNRRRERNPARLQLLTVSLLQSPRPSHRLPNQNRDRLPASTKNRSRFFPSSRTWNFIPRQI